ncbi:DUF192 domain-containing protein [Paracoccus sp. TK19116]|uniref:DUF192 domain-containing protein n=1 Tax=Paracoccus albicereus TaxID=2922394 RepID=A0ABT1MPY6_9RHOB|nr:DUF192 domain-containing protein [Paracoccus albicereus]MCQ0970360.1 DUF192 domain-containing protein [Paracoccus albicereus]
MNPFLSVRRKTLCLALTAFALSVGGAHAATQVCAADRAIFMTPAGPLSFEIEVADDVAERAQGLMNRARLPEKTGMLFVYQTPQPVAFWMRNTLIPLDMVFMDAEGVIRYIHENAIPQDETPIPGNEAGDPDPDRLMVLEIGGGEAARLGLAEGQAMAHPALDQDRAAFPCG